MDLNLQTRSLIQALKETSEYKKLASLRTNSANSRAAQKKVKELKDTQFQLYQAKLGGKDLDAKKKEQLTARVEALSKEPDVSEYLKAEMGFQSVLYKTLNTIHESVSPSIK